MAIRLLSFVLVIALAIFTVAEEPSLSELHSSKVGSLDAVGVEFSQLFLRNSAGNKNARIYLGRGDNSYSVGVNSQGSFSVATTQGTSATTPPGDESCDKDIFVVTKDAAITSNLIARTVQVKEFQVNSVPQWRLHNTLLFNEVPAQWSSNPIVKCGGVSFLSINEAQKTLTGAVNDLPKTDLVKIAFTAHFVDDWQGETVYLKVNNNYVWTDAHELRTGAKGINICGSDRFVETKFTLPIEITLPLTSQSIDFEFGTTLEDGSAGVFGISAISVYTRSK